MLRTPTSMRDWLQVCCSVVFTPGPGCTDWAPPAAQPPQGGREQVSPPRDTLCLYLPSTRVRGCTVPPQGRGGTGFLAGDLHSSRDAQLNNCWCQDKKTEMFRCTRRSENQKKSGLLHTKVNQNKDLRSRCVRNSRSNAGALCTIYAKMFPGNMTKV